MAVHYQQQWEFPSKSNPSKPHKVSLKNDGTYICDCWPFLRSRKDCKHIMLAKGGAKPKEHLTEEQEIKILLDKHADEGYRYWRWFPADSMMPWDRRSLEEIKHDRRFVDTRCFTVGSRKIVVVKEHEWVYAEEIKNFRVKLEGIDFRRMGRAPRAIKKRDLKKEYDDIVQHVLFNKTGTVMNPNLPEDSTYNSGTYGAQLHALSQRYRWLKGG